MPNRSLTPNQAVHSLLDVSTALETFQTLPDEQMSAGAKILLNFVSHAVFSCAVVLDEAIDVDAEGEN